MYSKIIFTKHTYVPYLVRSYLTIHRFVVIFRLASENRKILQSLFRIVIYGSVKIKRNHRNREEIKVKSIKQTKRSIFFLQKIVGLNTLLYKLIFVSISISFILKNKRVTDSVHHWHRTVR